MQKHPVTAAGSAPTSRRKRWFRRAAIGSGVALVLFTVIGFLVVPPVARRVAQTQLGELLGRKVVIDRVRLNPFALSLTVEGLHIFEADGRAPFVEFKRFYVNAQLSSVYRRAPVVKEISLDGLRLHVERRTASAGGWGDLTTYNFSDVLARVTAGPPAPPEPPAPVGAPPPRFSVNNIRLTDGKLVFEDRPTGAHHEVSDLSIGIPFVSTLPVFIDSFVEPGLSVRVDGTPFAAQGRSKPFKDSLETTLELRLDALDLTKYVPFVPLELPFTVESARLTVALDLAFVRPRIDAPSLSVKGRVALADLDVREKRGTKAQPTPLMKLGKLELAIADANLTTQRFHVSHVNLTGLEIHARRQRNGVLNLQQMAPRAPATEAAPSKQPKVATAKRPKPDRDAAAPRFTVDAIDLSGIKVHLEDQTTTPAFHLTVDDTSLAVRGLSNVPGASATVEFGARAVPGGVIKQQGTLVLEPHLRAKGTVAVDGIQPARFAPYYADAIAFDIVKGAVRVGSAYDVEDKGAAMAVTLEQAFVELTDFALRRRDKRDDFLRLGLVAVRGAKLELGARKVAIGEVTLADGKLRAERDGKGVVDLTTLVPGPPSVAPSTAKPSPPSSPDGAAAAGPAWAVTVGKLDIDRWGVRFDDRAVQPRAQLSVDPLSLHVTDISTVPGSRMNVNLRLGLNRTGTLTITGTGGYQPVAANLRFDLKTLDIVPFQPYFRDQVSLDVTGGALSLKGQATVELPPAPPRGAPARPPKANLEADLEIAGFASVDRARQENLVQWKSFRVTGVKLGTTPMTLRVSEIGLDDLQARVALLPDGTNLAHAFAPAARPATGKSKVPATAVASTSAPKPAVAEKPPQIDVGQVVIRRGAVQFSDRTVQPNVSTEITDLGGRISGLSSTADTQANIDLRAAINRAGALSVTGQANPLAKELFADVKVDIKDVDLPPASPYAGRYVGYVVEKGKLGVSLAYHVANRKLEASNRLVLDQFTFGSKTDSPEAVKVPVRLAVAILKDRHGVIDLELPIAGSLDDPEFKVGRLILKVLGNLVVKAATAPFSYIASAFGGGDELSRLDFVPGSVALESKTQQKLTSLSKALTERPGLLFEVEGIADPKRDRESVRHQVLERLLAAERLAELQADAADSGTVVPSIDNLRIAPADRPRLLERLYKTRLAAKPAGTAAAPKPATAAELEKVLFDQVTVGDDELRALALRRATLVQATLTKAVPGANARLFLLKPRLDPGGARVDFHLKQD